MQHRGDRANGRGQRNRAVRVARRRACLISAAVSVALLLAVPGVAAAAPETFFVRDGATGTTCTEADPCGTVQEAVDAHRLAPEPGDVIDVGPGLFVGNVGADTSDDEGLTIRGTLDAGARATTLRGTDLGYDDLGSAVLIGACDGSEVELRDLAVDTEGADPSVQAIGLDGGSDLANVHARNQALVESTAGSVVATCQRGTRVDRSEIVAGDDDLGILAFDGLKLTRSEVTAADASAVLDASFLGSRQLNIRRSRLEAAPGATPSALVASSDLTVDSSLVIGGVAGVTPFAIDGWRIHNSTIDAGVAGAVDPTTPSLALEPSLSDPASEVDVDSSILVDGIDATVGEGTVTCVYSDLIPPTIGPDWVDACPIGAAGNTTSDPADLFVAGAPYDFELKTGSPAVDTGQPGAIPAGLSIRDLAGKRRRTAGILANCSDPVRDKGAYEFAGPPCSASPPTLTNGAAPVVGTKLGGNPGKWSNAPTGFENQFLRCDATGDGCVPIMDYRSGTSNYRAGLADVGHTLRIRYIASNAAGASDPAVSAPTGVVTQDAPVNVSPPTIEGGESPTPGTALESRPGEWSNPPLTYQRQWLRCDAAGDDCAPITDYRARGTYTPRAADLGHTLRVRVIATNAAGESDPATSEPTGVVG